MDYVCFFAQINVVAFNFPILQFSQKLTDLAMNLPECKIRKCFQILPNGQLHAHKARKVWNWKMFE